MLQPQIDGYIIPIPSTKATDTVEQDSKNIENQSGQYKYYRKYRPQPQNNRSTVTVRENLLEDDPNKPQNLRGLLRQTEAINQLYCSYKDQIMYKNVDFIVPKIAAPDIKNTTPLRGEIDTTEYEKFLVTSDGKFLLDDGAPPHYISTIEFTWYINDLNTVTTEFYYGKRGTVNTPIYIENVEVTELDCTTFCYHDYVTNVTIPNNITKIY